jgi:hypothetical protein
MSSQRDDRPINDRPTGDLPTDDWPIHDRPINDRPTTDSPTVPDPGLCRNCEHARRIESDRGSLFLMCKLSFEDSRFAKYPRLPVLTCSGYRPRLSPSVP